MKYAHLAIESNASSLAVAGIATSVAAFFVGATAVVGAIAVLGAIAVAGVFVVGTTTVSGVAAGTTAVEGVFVGAIAVVLAGFFSDAFDGAAFLCCSTTGFSLVGLLPDDFDFCIT